MADAGRARLVRALADSDEPLSAVYDLAMLDLDGVVYRGDHVIDGVVDCLDAALEAGMRLSYVTNNASRRPEQVVERLRRMQVPVHDGDVVTSAQAAARLARSIVPAKSAVLVVGGAGLVSALAEHDLRPVESADDEPAAVVQGFAPELSWTLLAEGAYAVATGIPWIASNTDLTIPTSRGVAPGNGAFVQAISAATGRQPIVAGKPEPPLFDETVRRVGGDRPLVIGDRLDTDIEGANAVGADSLAVLTGISTLTDLAHAHPRSRPTFVGVTLAALNQPQPALTLASNAAQCAGVEVSSDESGVLEARSEVGPADRTALVRATLGLAWARLDSGRGVDLGVVHDLVVGEMR